MTARTDMLISLRWTLTFLVLSILYTISVYNGGPNYLQDLLITVYDATHGTKTTPNPPKIEF